VWQLRRRSDHGETVFECEPPKRRERRGGKNDVVDATLAARRVVSGEGLSTRRGGGQRERLRGRGGFGSGRSIAGGE
jgi:hypothetical protein